MLRCYRGIGAALRRSAAPMIRESRLAKSTGRRRQVCCSVRRKVCKACDVGGGGLSGDLKVLTLQMCKAYPADDDATSGVSTGAVVAHTPGRPSSGACLSENRETWETLWVLSERTWVGVDLRGEKNWTKKRRFSTGWKIATSTKRCLEVFLFSFFSISVYDP